jgi:hypothetical protein
MSRLLGRFDSLGWPPTQPLRTTNRGTATRRAPNSTGLLEKPKIAETWMCVDPTSLVGLYGGHQRCPYLLPHVPAMPAFLFKFKSSGNLCAHVIFGFLGAVPMNGWYGEPPWCYDLGGLCPMSWQFWGSFLGMYHMMPLLRFRGMPIKPQRALAILLCMGE